MRILVYEELKPKKGIDYSRDHLRRKEKKLEFPHHINLGEGRIAWLENEIDS
jgi:predicted DNA-binding transcriptional regulator AlpA